MIDGDKHRGQRNDLTARNNRLRNVVASVEELDRFAEARVFRREGWLI